MTDCYLQVCVRNTVTVYDYHNVAAMILLHTGWVSELNFQVSFLNELSAEIIIASSCLELPRNQTKHYNLKNKLLNSLLLRSHQATHRLISVEYLTSLGSLRQYQLILDIWMYVCISPILPRFQVIEIEAISCFVQKATFSRAKSLKARVP